MGREDLILKYLPLVKVIARKLFKNVNSILDLDDFVSAGTIGLIKAIDNRDKNKGDLQAYIACRVKGHILDEIREHGYYSRKHKEVLNRLNNGEDVNEKEKLKYFPIKTETLDSFTASHTRLFQISTLDELIEKENEVQLFNAINTIPKSNNSLNKQKGILIFFSSMP